jgi:hypothetical protein
LNAGKAWWAANGVARLVFVVLLSLLLAGLAYLGIVALVLHFPPHAIH